MTLGRADRRERMNGLLWISLPYFTAGVVVEGGVVARAAPILRWASGKPAKELADWVRRKRGRMVWMAD